MLGLATVRGPGDPRVVLGLDRILAWCGNRRFLRPIVSSAAGHELVHVAQEVTLGALTLEWKATNPLLWLLLFILAPFFEFHAYLLFPLSILTAAAALVIFASIVFGLPALFIAG